MSWKFLCGSVVLGCGGPLLRRISFCRNLLTRDVRDVKRLYLSGKQVIGECGVGASMLSA